MTWENEGWACAASFPCAQHVTDVPGHTAALTAFGVFVLTCVLPDDLLWRLATVTDMSASTH